MSRFALTNSINSDIALDAVNFGEPGKSSGSHRIYKTPWRGDAGSNIQNDKGMTKAYQVKQVSKAIDLIEKNQPIT